MPATTLNTLSLHDALPISIQACDGVYLSADRQLLIQMLGRDNPVDSLRIFVGHAGWAPGQLEAEIARRDWTLKRSEEHTSELQSHVNLVCRLLLEKKKHDA